MAILLRASVSASTSLRAIPAPNYNTDVLYQPNLLQIRRPEDLILVADRLPRTKHESWSYEQEVRMYVGLTDPPDTDKLHWIEFGPLLVLKEVIIGAQCDPTMSKKVEEAVKPYGDAVNAGGQACAQMLFC